jgi:hypothetical protein
MTRLSYSLVASALALGLMSSTAQGHDVWSNGEPVPAWIKSSCCGISEAHMLGPDEVWLADDGWHFRDIDAVIPRDQVLPSQDGQTWGFWNPALGRIAIPVCFFAPMEF